MEWDLSRLEEFFGAKSTLLPLAPIHEMIFEASGMHFRILIDNELFFITADPHKPVTAHPAIEVGVRCDRLELTDTIDLVGPDHHPVKGLPLLHFYYHGEIRLTITRAEGRHFSISPNWPSKADV